ncbi:MAG: alpha/beta hydrolase [Ichthyobacteriaceae bacterium]|nr:alpha/beta hydrolase [Ichthyobacteriaceae bacterium]
MFFKKKKEENFKFIDKGEGQPIILLHGLMGGLSNFDAVIENLSKDGYRVIAPELPIYNLPLLKTNVKNLTNHVNDLIDYLNLENVVIVGNSLGGHIALLFAKNHPEKIRGMVLTGSSGLYENSMGDTYPKRGDYDYIKTKTEEVFYDPKMATKELVDEIYDTVNDRNKAIRILSIAKSAIRHNMAKDITKMNLPTCLIWGDSDTVTPPEVAKEFDKLMPNSELHWVEKCGHSAMQERPEEFNRILDAWMNKTFK